MGAAQPFKQLLVFEPFELDLMSRELRKHGVRIKLQEQPLQILELLLQHVGEIVTREEIRRKIWPPDTFVEFDKGLYNAIKKLREALGESAVAPRFIQTVPRQGYRFIARVNVLHRSSQLIVGTGKATVQRILGWEVAAVLAGAAVLGSFVIFAWQTYMRAYGKPNAA